MSAFDPKQTFWRPAICRPSVRLSHSARVASRTLGDLAMATVATPTLTGRKGRAWARDRLQPFYVAIGFVALGAIAVGFSTTYIGPMARRDFHAPLIVHIHGLFAL